MVPPLISRCSACREFFWVRDARRLVEKPIAVEEAVTQVTQITLEHAGRQRTAVSHLLSRELGKTATKAKQVLDGLPVRLGAWSPEEAEKLAARFEALGARVSRESSTARVMRSTRPLDWKEAPRLERPNKAALLLLLRKGFAQEPMREWELRQQLWWMSNAPHHEGAPWVSFRLRTRAAMDNMDVVATLRASDSDEHRLLRAEAQRELENFDEALAVLDEAPFPAPLSRVADFVRRLAREHLAEVRKLPLS
ncbi:hypothetical protein [Myxococcus qinghaiensis]|uniref:hypothetical protein n=1 Tax=Myxococcus qinghaiensis TaxID=2906758 RepID=UPI0020A7DA9B|nr:hypothetical protein [Myxococcus qinghaiensis]MCP3165482.1 hypothetical protein [Myxococcus qinghaiensis]